jgi:hypothetical protein
VEAAAAVSDEPLATRTCEGPDPTASVSAAGYLGEEQLEFSQHAAIRVSGGRAQCGFCPAEGRVALYSQSELLSQRLKAVIVVAALPACVVNAALPGDAVYCLV